jgi:hypothetical protein
MGFFIWIDAVCQMSDSLRLSTNKDYVDLLRPEVLKNWPQHFYSDWIKTDVTLINVCFQISLYLYVVASTTCVQLTLQMQFLTCYLDS